MDSPSVPLLVLTVIGLCAAVLWRARTTGILRPGELRACSLLLTALCCWAIASAVLASRGWYFDPRALQLLPLLLGFLVPSALVTASLGASVTLRMALRKLILWLPLRGLIAVHAIRITALGTIVQYLHGELPGHFILPVGVPDFAIGLTAVPLALRATPKRSYALLVLWNACGILIFVYAGFALHFSVPSPIQLFTTGPTTEEIFRFPLALVPTFLVPFFVGVHAATLWRLVRAPLATSEVR